jgi:hypothetical protein
MGLQDAAIAAAKAKAEAKAENENRQREHARIDRLHNAMSTPGGKRKVAQARALAVEWFIRMAADPREVEVTVFDINEQGDWLPGHDYSRMHYPAMTHLFWTIEGRGFYAKVNHDLYQPEMKVVVTQTGLPADNLIELGESLISEAEDTVRRGNWPRKVTREDWKYGRWGPW